jgi:hypothetical protein
MPLYPGGGGPKVGLGLWNYPIATVIIETVLFLWGIAVYARVTRARDGIGRWGLWGLIGLIAGSYYSTLFTPTPTDMRALAIGGIVFAWVFVVFAWWVDRHRDAVTSGRPAPL